VTAPEFEKYLTAQIEKNADKNTLIVNLKEVYYISKSGLRVILRTTKKLRDKQGDIILVALQGMVRERFEIAGFYSVLEIFKTEKSAFEKI